GGGRARWREWRRSAFVDVDLASAERVLAGGVRTDLDPVHVGLVLARAVLHRDRVAVGAGPVDRRRAEDLRLRRRRATHGGDVDRMHVHLRTLVLELLLAAQAAARRRLSVTAEIGPIAVVGRDPAAVRDLD